MYKCERLNRRDLEKLTGRDVAYNEDDPLEVYLNSKPSHWRLISANKIWHEGTAGTVMEFIWWVGDVPQMGS